MPGFVFYIGRSFLIFDASATILKNVFLSVVLPFVLVAKMGVEPNIPRVMSPG
jgi:hypothetical protein